MLAAHLASDVLEVNLFTFFSGWRRMLGAPFFFWRVEWRSSKCRCSSLHVHSRHVFSLIFFLPFFFIISFMNIIEVIFWCRRLWQRRHPALDNINGASELSSNWKSCRLCAKEKRGRPNRPWDDFELPHDAQYDSRVLAADGSREEHQPDVEWVHVGKEAEQNFGDLLLHLFYLRKLSARSACVFSWWASKAGAVGTPSGTLVGNRWRSWR